VKKEYYSYQSLHKGPIWKKNSNKKFLKCRSQMYPLPNGGIKTLINQMARTSLANGALLKEVLGILTRRKTMEPSLALDETEGAASSDMRNNHEAQRTKEVQASEKLPKTLHPIPKGGALVPGESY
jgi:hypothetical protein